MSSHIPAPPPAICQEKTLAVDDGDQQILFIIWKDNQTCSKTYYGACYFYMSDLTEDEIDFFESIHTPSEMFISGKDTEQNFLEEAAAGEFYGHRIDEPLRIMKGELKQFALDITDLKLGINEDLMSGYVFDYNMNVFQGIAHYIVDQRAMSQ